MAASEHHRPLPVLSAHMPIRYGGPERRSAGAAAPSTLTPPFPVWQWLSATLDEVDYGMLLLAGASQVLHINHAARAELDASHPLQLVGRELQARRSQDVLPLREALHCAAGRGLRKLLTLGEESERVSLSVVPLSAALSAGQPGAAHGTGATLVMLGKRQVCEQLSVQGFARSHALTPAETRVLVALCGGARPADIAAQLGVAISTVRTHVGSIRLKTGSPSIPALVRKVAVLPPLMGVLRGVPEPARHGETAGAAGLMMAA